MRPRRSLLRERAWGALEVLLETHPEGVATIAAVDRLTEYGLHEMDAVELMEDMRARGVLTVEGGRWRLR